MLFLFVNMTRYLCLKFNMFKTYIAISLCPRKGNDFKRKKHSSKQLRAAQSD